MFAGKYNLEQSIKAYALLVFFILTSGCGGGSSGSSSGTDANITDNDGTIVFEPVNTLGNNIAVDPTVIDLGATTQKEALTKKFTLTNGSGRDLKFKVYIVSNSGGFRFLNPDLTTTALYPEDSIARGASKEYTLAFDARLMGASSGYILITADGISGEIRLPVQARVTGAADYKIISSSYSCTSSTAPVLQNIDFMKVVSGKSGQRSIKICNTGGQNITLTSALFKANNSNVASESINEDFTDDFFWDITEDLDTAFFDYYNPETTEAFTEPSYVAYTGPAPDSVSAFSIKENSTGRSAKDLVIPAGKFMLLDITFTPNIDAEAPEGKIYQPIPYAASLEISTNLGREAFDVVGSTAGKEGLLSLTYAQEGVTTPSWVDLASNMAAINFGKASIYKDWIIEDTADVVVTFKNEGTGTKPLKIWIDDITSGYFTFKETDPETTFPLSLPAGTSKSVTMMYAPTPESITFSYDLGQAKIHQTGGSKPTNLVTLLGEQQSDEAVSFFLDAGKIKPDKVPHPYTEQTRKNFCVAQVGATTEKSFRIINRSSTYPLTTGIVLSPLTDDTGNTIAGVSADLSSNNFTTDVKSETPFTVNFVLAPTVALNKTINGRITVTNHYSPSAEQQYGISPSSYDVYFKIVSSETGECTGGGSPISGDAWYVVDRISLVLFGLSEPMRNVPSFRTQLPLQLDAASGWARLKGITYNPRDNSVDPVKLFRAYNHQISNVSSCMPLTTNPYKQEYQEGSWNGPAQCQFDNGLFAVKGTEMCMFNNGSQKSDPLDPNAKDVFYHEFVKFNPADCNDVEFEGRIATFYLNPDESSQAAYDRVGNAVGENGTLDEYQEQMRMFQFGSYIDFKKAYNKNGCNVPAGRVTDIDTIRTCWEAFTNDDNPYEGLSRYNGMVEECAYFYFSVEEGCVPQDAPSSLGDKTVRCSDPAITWKDPDTWKAFGEYEPYVDPLTGEVDDTRWDLSIRNIKLEASSLSSSLNIFFDNNAKLINTAIDLSFTTKPLGLKRTESGGYEYSNDLVAVNARSDFNQNGLLLNPNDDRTKGFFTEDGINSEYTTGRDTAECTEVQPMQSCKGNHVISPNGKIVVAGEPVDLENNNRTVVNGVTAFHGKGQLAPVFAREDGAGNGRGLTFTTHGCVVAGEEIANDVGCYEKNWDDDEYQQQYKNIGTLKKVGSGEAPADGEDDTAYIDYVIFEQDRQRYTDYYNYPDHLDFGAPNFYEKPCGKGM